MWSLFLFFALLLVVMMGGVFSDYHSKTAVPAPSTEVAAAIGKLNAFAQGALVYQQAIGVPGAAMNWNAIVAATTSKGLPPVLAGMTIDSASGSRWKVVPDGAGSYLICAEVPADSLSEVARMMPGWPSYSRTRTDAGGNPLEMQVFAADATAADVGADACK